jgi:hypothetical protein
LSRDQAVGHAAIRRKDWEFFRTTARADALAAHRRRSTSRNLQGIADGVKARGVDLDIYDIVALNAFEEVPDYYVPWLNKQTANKWLNKSQKTPKLSAPGELQRLHRHRQHDQRPPDRDRPQ